MKPSPADRKSTAGTDLTLLMNTLTKASESNAEKRNEGRKDYVIPLSNILENKEGYVLEAEMPGVSKDGVELTVSNGELTIVGHRTVSSPSGSQLYRESRSADYRRVFEIDPSIDTAKISASIDQGVLRLLLPKSEAVKPRKISVTD